MNTRRSLLAIVLPAVLAAAGCGGAGTKAPSSSSPTKPNATTPASTSPGALQAEAASAATGDIPDNQIYLAYRSPGGWSIKYPEGWARSGGPNATLFRDKSNVVRIVAILISSGKFARVENCVWTPAVLIKSKLCGEPVL